MAAPSSYFSERFIQRPVLAWVLNIVVIILGGLAFFELPVRHYPQVEQPVITIMTNFDGASPEVVEAQVTRPLEEILAGLEGLETMTSESIAEQSKVKLYFKATRSIDAAANDIQARLSREEKLPREASRPRMTKADADGEPVLNLALYGKDYDVARLYDYATRYLQSTFEAQPGVASLDIYGGASYEMHIVLDPVRLAGFKLTPQDVREALHRQNISKPAGRIGGDQREFLVVTQAQISKPEEFNNVVLAERNGAIIRISDVGYTEFSANDKRFRVKYNGQDAIMLGIVSQSRANPIDISREVHRSVEQIRENLPRGMYLEIANDRSVFIEKSIQQVYRSIWEAILLVVGVVFFFLRSLRASLIPLVTIPISLFGTFFAIYMLGFSINTLTLLALVLAIGLVVDDAIVVLENIYRHIEDGLSPIKAAFLGVREIQFSVIAMTLTLAAVYTPIALASGITGRLFTEFALTLVGAVLWSGFVALVLSPMMCSRLLRAHQTGPMEGSYRSWQRFDRYVERFLDQLDQRYTQALQRLFSIRLSVLGGSGFLGILCLLSSLWLPTEMAPREDQGVIRVSAQSPVGATLKYLDTHATAIDQILSQVPQVSKRLLLIQAGDDTYEKATLVPWGERPRCNDLIPGIQEKLNDITGIRAFSFCPSRSLMGGAAERPLDIVLQTSRPFKELLGVARRVRRMMLQNPGVRRADIDWDIAAESQEFTVKIKRDVAASLGVDIETIATVLDLLVSGRKATSFERDSKLYPVKLWMKEKKRTSPLDLKQLMVKGVRDRKETMVPLESLISVEEKMLNPEINHYGGMRSVRIMAGLNKGYGLGSVYAELKPQIQQILPPAFRQTASGELKRFLTEQSTIIQIFVLAIAFIFLVMAGQFESFRDPFIIILSVPLALAGAVLTLWILQGLFRLDVLSLGASLNIYSQIGLVTLVGLITKHGILIVDFANKLLEKGKSVQEAVSKACQLRLRPILMTTFAMVLGALPLALGSGPGFEARRQIGWVIVGGMSLGTLFTLFVVPLVYTLIARSKALVTEDS